MNEIVLKTSVNCTCCSGKKIHKKLFRIKVSDNGAVGPGYSSVFRMDSEYFCNSCGQVYLSTKKNRLKDFKTEHIEKILKITSSVSYSLSNAKEIVRGLKLGLWNDPIQNIFLKELKEDGSLRVLNHGDLDGTGSFDMAAVGSDYWLIKDEKIISWSKYKFVPKEESDLEKTPINKGAHVLKDMYQETLSRLDRVSFEKGTALKRVDNNVPLPDDAVGFRNIFGPWDCYKKAVRVPGCFL
jgi:hypothetical protein